MREHLKMAAPNHPMLQPFVMTPYESYLMAVFWQLGKDRQFDAMSGIPRSISLQTFVFYQQLFNDVLNTDEIEVLQHIDRAYIDGVIELRKDNNNG